MTKITCTDKSGKNFIAYINRDQICFIKPMSTVYENLKLLENWYIMYFTNGEQLFVKPENRQTFESFVY